MIGQQFVTTSVYADSQVDVDREVLMHISTDQPVFVQIARINHRDGSRIWEQADTPFPASDFVFDRCAGVRFKTNGATPANVYVVWTFHLDDVLIRRFSTNAPTMTDIDDVTSVFGRQGAVVAQNGDYYGVVAAALPGADIVPSRYVGASASIAPTAGTFQKGDFIVSQDGHIWVCTVAGSPGTWTNAGSVGNLVTSVFGRTGAIAAAASDYSLAQIAAGTNHTLPISGASVMGSLAAGAAGQFLKSNGAAADPSWQTTEWTGGPFNLNNTTALTTLVNISIPGNTLGTGGAILFVLSGYLQNNSGSSKGLALRVLFGGTTMWGDATSAIHYASGGGGVFPVLWFFVIGNYGATNNQVLTGFLGIGNTSAGSIAGTGQITGGVDSQTDMYGAAAVDTTVAQSLVVQAQLSAASPSWGFIETSKVILLP